MPRALYRRLLIPLALVFSSAGGALAHEVHASSTEVVVEDNRLEILQTTPIDTAGLIASRLSGGDAVLTNHDEILTAIGTSWNVADQSASCELKRAAYRLVHEQMEIQLRYLFECDAGSVPERLAATWPSSAPSDHFTVFTLNMDDKSETVIFQSGDIIMDLRKG